MWKERLPETCAMFVSEGHSEADFERLVEDWVEAGGDPEESVKRWMLGVGHLRNTPERYSMMAERGKSILEEIKRMGIRMAEGPQ
jgi:hypothetical protein